MLTVAACTREHKEQTSQSGGHIFLVIGESKCAAMLDNGAIGPGSGRALFEKLRSQNLLLPSMDEDDMQSWLQESKDTVIRTVRDLRMASPYQWEPLEGPFSFFAGSSLSGGPNPCASPQCRVRRVRAVGRFSSLYADAVLIEDPWERILNHTPPKLIGGEFINTLIVLHALRAEIEAGIVRFAPSHFPLSPEGKQEFEQVDRAYAGQLQAIEDPLVEEVLSHVEITVERTGEYPYLSLEGTSRYVPHEGVDILVESEALEDDRFPSDDFIRKSIWETFLEPTLADLQLRHLFNWLYDVKYLTDRPIDRDALYMIEDSPNPQKPRFSPEIDHNLPFVDNLDPDTLIRLREEEGEAFRVYRDKVKELVEEGPEDPEEFREAFQDLVQPELNKIDKAVRNAREMAKRKVKEKLAFGVGTASIGLASGTISPEIGTVVSAIGGLKFGTELLSELSTLLGEPEIARENDYFYLREARQETI